MRYTFRTFHGRTLEIWLILLFCQIYFTKESLNTNYSKHCFGSISLVLLYKLRFTAKVIKICSWDIRSVWIKLFYAFCVKQKTVHYTDILGQIDRSSRDNNNNFRWRNRKLRKILSARSIVYARFLFQFVVLGMIFNTLPHTTVWSQYIDTWNNCGNINILMTRDQLLK